MVDLEAALAAHLNGKFFWEPTSNPDDQTTCKDMLDLRKAQKEFSKGAKHYTSRNKVEPPPAVVKVKPLVLQEDQKVLEPIINAISHAYKIAPSDLMGRSTSYKFAKAKHHFCWAMFKYIPGLSYAEAGRITGKCHTTIMHGKEMFQKNQDFAKVVEVDQLMGWK